MTPTPLTGEATAEVLERAADLLSRPGAWMQDNFCDALGADRDNIQRATCWCAAGAVAHVLGESGPEGENWLLERGVDTLFGELTGQFGVIGFNDRSGRTQAEVVAALRLAATRAREESRG